MHLNNKLSNKFQNKCFFEKFSSYILRVRHAMTTVSSLKCILLQHHRLKFFSLKYIRILFPCFFHCNISVLKLLDTCLLYTCQMSNLSYYYYYYYYDHSDWECYVIITVFQGELTELRNWAICGNKNHRVSFSSPPPVLRSA